MVLFSVYTLYSRSLPSEKRYLLERPVDVAIPKVYVMYVLEMIRCFAPPPPLTPPPSPFTLYLAYE
jgi:hypothetical protein